MADSETETGPAPSPGTGRRQRHGPLAATIAGIAIGVGIGVAVPEVRHSVSLVFHGEFAALRTYIRSLDAGGLALLLALMLAHALIFYPTEIVTATAAYVYGFLPGLVFVMCGWIVSALLSYLLGRVLGRPALRALLGRRFTSLERAVERGGLPLLLSGRLIPVVPFSLMGYAAGAARVRVGRFTWTTAVGFLPLTAAVAYLGSRAESLSLSDPAVWVAVVALVGLFGAAHLISRRRRL